MNKLNWIPTNNPYVFIDPTTGEEFISSPDPSNLILLVMSGTIAVGLLAPFIVTLTLWLCS